MVSANLPAYFATWSDEITSRADRVRNLIGDKHWLSDGTYKEFLIREFLARYLPSHLNVSRGFIRHLEIDAVSPEIDILIADPCSHAPIFREGDFQIAPPSSVLATLEVKSTYRAQVLRAALVNVAMVRAVAATSSGGPTMWSAVMIVTGDDSLTCGKLISDCKSVLESPQFWKEAKSDYWSGAREVLLPSVVCVLDQAIVLLDAPEHSRTIQLRAFATKTLSAALAFAQLFAYLREILSKQRHAGELETVLRNLDGISFVSDSVELPIQ